jgi:GNAT superfamily N-acetyltransferase
MDLPDIPGVGERAFHGPEDYETVAVLVNADGKAAGQEWIVTAEDVALSFENQVNLDVSSGLRLVEIEGEPVGYVVVRWMKEVDGPHIYRHMCKLMPEWRGKGIGTAMLRWAQARLRDIAAGHDAEPKVFRTSTDAREEGVVRLLEDNGYRAIQHNATLVRPHLEGIPSGNLPDGLEIRPV